MDKFLIELLLKNNSVILPDFGAIVIANEIKGEVMFNEYLKFNDGKLIALIVANSSMDEQDASNMVAKYIRDIQIQLDKGESYDIFGLGSFTKDKDGSTLFNGNINSSNKKETEEIAGPSPTPPKETKEKKKEAPIKDKKKEEPKEEERPEIDLTVSSPEQEVKKEQEKPVEKSVVEKPKKAAENVAKPKKVKPPKEKKEKKKRGFFFWIMTFLLVIVAGGGVFIGVKYEAVIAYMGWDKFETTGIVAETDETTIPEEESNNDPAELVAVDTLSNSENDIIEPKTNESEELNEVPAEEIVEPKVEKTVTEKPINTSGKSFHLIAGSFSELSNAEGFVSDLKSKGMPAHIVGQFNGLHMVSAKSFATRSEAVAELSTIQNEATGAWLFKYPK